MTSWAWWYVPESRLQDAGSVYGDRSPNGGRLDETEQGGAVIERHVEAWQKNSEKSLDSDDQPADDGDHENQH